MKKGYKPDHFDKKLINPVEKAQKKEQAKAALVDQRQKLNQNLIKNNSQQVVAGGKASTKDESKSVNTFGHFKKSFKLADSVQSPNSLRQRKLQPIVSDESNSSWDPFNKIDPNNLSKLSSERRSVLTTPLVEFASLGKNIK